MPGRAPKDKGNRLERLIVDILNSYGLPSKRVPLSGSARGFKGDVHTRAGNQDLVIEAKSRRNGFQFIYQSLGTNDALVIKADRGDPIICLNLRRFANLISQLSGVKAPPSYRSEDPSIDPPSTHPANNLNEWLKRPIISSGLKYPVSISSPLPKAGCDD